MGDISQHFSRYEFQCKCGECGRDAVDAELLKILEFVRQYFGQPIRITSANRCEKHNKAIMGSQKSQHLLSKAVDLKVKMVEPILVYNLLNETFPTQYGIGYYDETKGNFTHFDVRQKKARWGLK